MKKILLLLISSFLIIVSLNAKIDAASSVIVESYVVTNNAYLYNSDGTFDEKNLNNTSVNAGDKYYLIEYNVSDYSFIGYTYKGVWQTKNSLTINSDTYLTAYYVATTTKAAILLSQGNVFETIQINTTGVLNTSSITSISATNGYTFNNNYKVIKTGTNYNIYNPVFTNSFSNYQINLVNATASSSSISYDSTVTVTSTQADFTCFKINGKVVSYTNPYTFPVYSNVTITSSNETVAKTPFINCESIGNNMYYCNYELVDYELVETGMIFGGTTFNTASKKVKALNISSYNSYIIKCSTLTYNAYLTYKDSAGTYYTVMSDGSDQDIYSNKIYASSTGTGTGTYANPYSLTSAISALSSGMTLYLLPGTYTVSSPVVLSKTNTSSNPIRIYAYQGGDVTLDYTAYRDADQGDGVYTYNKSSHYGIDLSGSYYHIKGIKTYNSGSSGIKISGHYNIVEDSEFENSGNSGLQISRSSSSQATIDTWPTGNLVLNCSSYGSYDYSRASSAGEDADGFAAKLTCGYNNVFDGCMAYNNSDDGWDLFTKRATGAIGAIQIKNCMAFNNGYAMDNTTVLKNGNGFKMGGRAIEVSHSIENSIAFSNLGNGFDDNSNPGTISVTNCTAYNNGRVSGKNFAMGRFTETTNTYTSTWTEDGVSYGPIEGVNGSHNNFSNCLSYGNSSADSYRGYANYSYFSSGTSTKYLTFTTNQFVNYNDSSYKGTTVTNSETPFVSVSEPNSTSLLTLHKTFRNSNGEICLGDFLKITGSYLTLGDSSSSLGADLSGSYDSEASILNYNQALALLSDTASVTLYERICNCQSAYNALSEADKATVDYATLQNATNDYNQSLAQTVIDLITNIGTVTTSSGTAITEARTAYDALSSGAKAYVTNYLP